MAGLNEHGWTGFYYAVEAPYAFSLQSDHLQPSLGWGMPTLFDDFSERSGRDFRGGSSDAWRNMKLLEEAMVRHGFVGYPTEWWHFDIEDWERYPLADVPLKAEKR
ncbi:MAG: M15 family metallopeptidase [Verrucomicrobiae bacterium]|nr:M15 family metallopeptidase [Verrucomicrobiae bacterium]